MWYGHVTVERVSRPLRFGGVLAALASPGELVTGPRRVDRRGAARTGENDLARTGQMIGLEVSGDTTVAGPSESADEPVGVLSVSAPSAGEPDTAGPGARDTAQDGQESADGQRDARPRWRTPARWLVAAALVAVLAGSGFGGWLLFQRHQKDVAAREALAAAEKFVVTLTCVDSNTMDKHVAEVLAASTGEFNNNYSKSVRGQHRQLIVNNQVTTRGRVVESAVKSVSPHKVQVLLMVDQSVTSRAAPEPQIDRSRIKMTMEKVGGRWLVSKVELL